MRVYALLCCVASSALAVPAVAQVRGVPTPDADQTPTDTSSSTPSDIVVTAKRLDTARAHIQPSLGASNYEITSETIKALPGGENQQFNQILLQAPGIVQDGFGQFHVRDDHNGLQYRINGTILPEGWRCSARPCRRAWSTRSTS
jgi:hypothetical protein